MSATITTTTFSKRLLLQTQVLQRWSRRGRGRGDLHQLSEKRCLTTGAATIAARPDRPFHLAVIGAGPAGFYTAYRVLSKLANAKVDMYESLPVPYGLVRFGVAPDHPEVKNCQDKFNEVAQDPRFTYIGNTPIGTSWPHPPHRSLPLTVLAPHYDALLLSYGASKDRKLHIPNEDSLVGVHSARAFVGWYNGLPEYRNLKPELHLAEEATVIGQGNVALDVARILLSRLDDLRRTDMTEYAIEELSRSKVKRVRVVGRRGPLQAAFTVKELRELLSLQGVGFHPISPPSLLPHDPSSFPRAQKRILQLLQKGPKTSLPEAEKSWELAFLRSPRAFLPSTTNPSRIGAIQFEENTLQHPIFSPTSPATGTGETEVLKTDLAFRSIGYLSERIPGFEDLGIPFNDARGLVPNEDGRVVTPLNAKTGEPAVPVPGVYTSGWVKRGPTGVIASTMYDAFDTGDRIVEDWTGEVGFMKFGGVERKFGWEAIRNEVAERGMRPISWAQWMKIDEAEKERGKRAGKEREKFTSEEEMLAVLG
ncbi:FAD/NAD(P)-binding domain-containing protein [Choiromyces venosus 120613-1]|uniref:NADPH:adrenodoxin oxidoreductase, mitochondrial n=1 Tax=Choiromyces venosus 120613-1 TaxID=1336337 RepID=A0A3N4JBY8_9PEZI|nr:FAD/NAD(P)-binding domain-containing protein [Choiromyces venosus 120613-1]